MVKRRLNRTYAMPGSKICLCMIVRNESRIIERCLDSVVDIIDYVSVCDTGSTDGTPGIIGEWCGRNGIPGTVHHEPFRNFGYNRTLSVSLAHAAYPRADYLLLLDADMVVEDARLDKGALVHDQYMSMQYDSSVRYWLPRLLKASLPWVSVGVTHEYWDIDRSRLPVGSGPISVGKLEGLLIRDETDGGSKSDKFERDKRLLLGGLEDPETPSDLKGRYMFYLAQTHSCLGEWEEAIDWYRKRVAYGGWFEEIFYSLYRIGNCYLRLHDRDRTVGKTDGANLAMAVKYLLEAWEYRPCRAEPLYNLAEAYRIMGRHNTGLMFALQGRSIPFPKDDVLFIDYHVYDYLFDYEVSICANHIPHMYGIGLEAEERLLSMLDRLPPRIAGSVRNNARFYGIASAE